MAGMAFTNIWLGIVHSMSHQIGSTFGIPHGCGNAILMPNIIRFNSKLTDKYCELAALSGRTSAEEFAQQVSKLRASAGVVGSLKEYDINQKEWDAKLDTLTQNAMDDPCALFNRKKPKLEEIKTITI